VQIIFTKFIEIVSPEIRKVDTSLEFGATEKLKVASPDDIKIA
jgi:hypothetical protein